MGFKNYGNFYGFSVVTEFLEAPSSRRKLFDDIFPLSDEISLFFDIFIKIFAIFRFFSCISWISWDSPAIFHGKL
jgi:hypothetical protein